MKYNYICVKQELWHKDIGNYIAFAVALNNEENIIQSDVCCEKDIAQSLVELLDKLQIEPEQVKYIIEDEVYAR